MRRRFPWIILMGLVFVVSICNHAGAGEFGPFRGKILDADTKEPIEGVVVFIEWREKHGFKGSTFYDAQETLTDKNGEFYIPGIWAFNPLVWIRAEADAIIYKSGYEAIGFSPWLALLKAKTWRQPVEGRGNYILHVEDGRPVIMLKKLIDVDKRWENVGHANPGSSTPDEKKKLLMEEFNREEEILRKIKP